MVNVTINSSTMDPMGITYCTGKLLLEGWQLNFDFFHSFFFASEFGNLSTIFPHACLGYWEHACLFALGCASSYLSKEV